MSYDYYMLDIESLSLDIDHCPVYSIACVYTDLDADPLFSPHFNIAVKPDMSRASSETLLFHLKNDPKVLESVLTDAKDGVDIKDAIEQLADFIRQYSSYGTELWMQGKDFDYPVLKIHAGCDPFEIPFYRVRCNRDLVALHSKLLPAEMLPERDKVALPVHNALADVQYQCQVHNFVMKNLLNLGARNAA